MEELTKETYITNHNFLSYSTVSGYMYCEAATLAHYREPSTTAKLVGSYVDAYFSEEMDEFKEKHPEIFNSKTGALKADFAKAETIIERIKSDEVFMHYLSGEKQKIMTGEIGGMKFKIKMDSYIENEAIVDLKVMKDFKRVWSTDFRSYQPFIIAYNYDIEMAIFQEIVYQNTGKRLPCIIAAITKEEPSDVGVFEISQDILDRALRSVENNLPRIKEILEGKIKPKRCGKCAYCRGTKKAELFKFTGDELNENDEEEGEIY